MLRRGGIRIYYPHVTGLKDKKKQGEINELLKEGAFADVKDWKNTNNYNIDDFSLTLEYAVLYQSANYLSVNYTGFAYVNDMPYPRNLFYTININIEDGHKLRLSDMVNIDHFFVQIIRKYLQHYVTNGADNTAKGSNILQNELEYSNVYKQILKKTDDEFIEIFMKADLSYNGCNSYFTKDVFGISFEIGHVSGDHFEIELRLADMPFKSVMKKF
ncbi:MAG: DUF4163 domain-containing protein [Oscillospiraceae bacterium]|nr:DUF4163 domain-containing protein [Oscillospiraceae bacterium]